jgi:hypothetical protein
MTHLSKAYGSAVGGRLFDEASEVSMRISDRPEEGPVQTFAPNRADQPFNEGCENGTSGTVLTSWTSRTRRFVCRGEPMQGIMVRAQVRRGLLASRCSVEQPAQCHDHVLVDGDAEGQHGL